MSDIDSPFNDVRDLLSRKPEFNWPKPDEQPESVALASFGLGRLHELADWISASQRTDRPKIEKPTVALFAASHGLATHGVSISPDGATELRVATLRDGKSPGNALAGQVGGTLRVFELAVEHPTKDIAFEPALSEQDCAATIAFGMEALADEPDCLSLGVIGIGGGTAAAAVACGLYGGNASYWVRAGNHVPVEVNQRRASLVERAIDVHRGHLDDPLEVLRRLGGREMAACVGAIIAARHQGIPVVLDGFATAVAAGVVHSLDPGGIDHVVASHVSDRPTHRAILERLGKKALVELGLEIGEGVGATLAINLLRSACLVRATLNDAAS